MLLILVFTITTTFQYRFPPLLNLYPIELSSLYPSLSVSSVLEVNLILFLLKFQLSKCTTITFHCEFPPPLNLYSILNTKFSLAFPLALFLQIVTYSIIKVLNNFSFCVSSISLYLILDSTQPFLRPLFNFIKCANSNCQNIIQLLFVLHLLQS